MSNRTKVVLLSLGIWAVINCGFRMPDAVAKIQNPAPLSSDVILRNNCIQCHRTGAAQSGVDMSTKTGLAKVLVDGRFASVVTSGKMPPNKKLAQGERDVLNKLATKVQGQKAAASLWSMERVRSGKGTTKGSDIDGFIRKKLARLGLDPNGPATPQQWLRRVTIDVTGLPPTFMETKAFLLDSGPSARGRVVNRLLAEPAYGEKMARLWLDVARFGESQGYEQNHLRENAWPYRDYVIRSFNADKPYSTFVMEQLAGDLIGKGNADILPATGFLVAGVHDTVGTQVEEGTRQQRSNDLEDVVSTVGATLMGVTVGCARCHDHKFDPIKQRDYYALEALFSGVYHGETDLPEAPMKPRPDMSVWLKLQLNAHNELLSLKSLARARTEQGTGLRPEINSQWNEDRLVPSAAKYLRFEIFSTNDGAQPCIDELQVFGPREPSENLALQIRGTRVVADSLLPGYREHSIANLNDGRFGNTHSWISNTPGKGTITLEFDKVIDIDKVVWSRDAGIVPRFDDRIATQYAISVSLDGKAWTVIGTQVGRRDGVRYVHPDQIVGAMTQDEKVRLARYEKAWKDILGGEDVMRQARSAYTGRFTEPDATYLLTRGDVMQRTERILPSVPGLMIFTGGNCDLTQAKEGERRLAFGRWLTSGKHPTVARVFVNRVWQHLFGRGLVPNPSDFGNMGGPPSHPELLDALADGFVRSGWSVKNLVRLMVLSSTYAQSSKVNRKSFAKDGDNIYLWRMPVRRLDAEGLRDALLFVSGNLNRHLYGKGFQLFGYDVLNVARYTEVELPGPQTWRRGIYSIAARGVRDPFMGTFDCPESAVRTAKRENTVTALQALAMWNGPFTIQQATFLANRATSVKSVFHLAIGRAPDAAETELLAAFTGSSAKQDAAKVLLNSGAFLYY